MTGIELDEELCRTKPAVVPHVCFMTGGAFTPKAEQFLDLVRVNCIDKPIDRGQLLSLLVARP